MIRNGGWVAVMILNAGAFVYAQAPDHATESLAPERAARTEAASSPAMALPRSLDGQEARPFLDERLKYWQQRLNLRDWQICIVMARRGDMKPKTLGKVRWDKHRKTAIIEVLDPRDYTLPQDAIFEDMELTVVHELVHLELASLPRSEASRSSEEHAVNQIADALLGLNRHRE